MLKLAYKSKIKVPLYLYFNYIPTEYDKFLINKIEGNTCMRVNTSHNNTSYSL